ncbi:conjugal transfer protein TraH [Pantoea brenneri]|nr:conjugal transfer protein TraH [Pantoea brenneri]
MKLSIFSACLCAFLLAGCQSATGNYNGRDVKQAEQPHPAADAKNRVKLQLQQLWLEGDMNGASSLPFAAIRADSDRITLSWNGDAVELLSALARARGQTFSYTGVRLPLPLDIDVQSITYANLLRIIQMQTAWRAALVTYPGQMVLQFMPSLPAEPVRHKKGSRR